ncbi:MAG: IS982 family transposase [Candidatus Kapaibacterium sp.]|nr:MAG: IS982 family transposase [Candidatus Kapabacteria bacterium]
MSVEERLISVYLLVCSKFPFLAHTVERMSRTKPPECTDEEVLTIYLFGILQRHFTSKDIHKYAKEHWLPWFPALPNYEAFNHPLLRLAPAFDALSELLAPMLPRQAIFSHVVLIDSMPIVLARAGRADTAKVAREIADKGYCATKKLYYHGVKLHAMLNKGHQCLPRLTACELSKASEHDVHSLRRQIDMLHQCDIYGDRAYFYHQTEDICQEQENVVWAVKPRTRGQKALPTDEVLRNTSISRMRQPIESWFNWLQEKTHMEQASKVRSTKGLIVHTLGRLSAAVIALIFNF